MRFLSTMILSLSFFLFERCNVCSCKQVTCPAFNDTTFSQWFPYNKGDTLIFQNDTTYDTISFYDIEKSSAYDIKRGCYGSSNGCTANCRITSNETYDVYRKLHVSIDKVTPFESSATGGMVFFNLYAFNCQSNNIADTGLVTPSVPSKYLTSLNIGGKIYNNVQVFQQDTSGSMTYTGPYKVYLQKNKGVVAYENYPDLKLWVKQ